MKTFRNALPLLILMGCASSPDKTLVKGQWQVDDERLTTGMPNFVLSPEIFEKSLKQATRAVASSPEEKKPSLRRLYFRSLYGQWKDLSHVTGGEALRSCPQFHHDKVTMDEESSLGGGFNPSKSRPSRNELAYYPEWTLPVRIEGELTPVFAVQKNRKENLERALKSHARKLKNEIATICEEGSSDAYFRLENMVTYIVDKPSFQTREGLAALLKIPVFSTMLLLKSAQGLSEAQFSVHDTSLLKEVRGFQLQHYIVELRKQRQLMTTGAL